MYRKLYSLRKKILAKNMPTFFRKITVAYKLHFARYAWGRRNV